MAEEYPSQTSHGRPFSAETPFPGPKSAIFRHLEKTSRRIFNNLASKTDTKVPFPTGR